MTLYSPEGGWWWDGSRWVPLYRPERQLSPFWWAETPEWFSRVVLMGLIGLIPFAGTMALYGWFLSLRDHLLEARWELPRPGFSYLERGLRVFAAAFVYGLGILAVGLVAGSFFLVLLAGLHRLVAGIFLGLAVFYLVVLALQLPLAYCYLALLDLVDRAGLGAALNPVRLMRHAYANNRESLAGAGIYLLGLLAIVAVGSVIPFGSLAASLGLPAVLATIGPGFARFQPEGPARPG